MSNAILGIDVGKAELAIALLIEGNFSNAKVCNNIKGYKEILKLLKSLKITKVTACLEATGRYGEAIAEFLYAHNHDVAVVNPFCIKSFANSKLTIHKTDPVDAKVIAEYASKNNLVLFKPREPVIQELREHCKALEAYKNHQTLIKNQIEQASSSKVVKSWKRMQKHIIKEIEMLEENIKEVIESNREMKEHCDNLQTIPGIGKTTALSILGYMPDIKAFQSARQLAAYSGLVPRQHTSGSSVRGKSKLSKMGSSRLRKTLYFPAISASRFNPVIAAFCDNLKRRGKAKMSIIGAAMRKLLHIVFAILKHKTTFNPLPGN